MNDTLQRWLAGGLLVLSAVFSAVALADPGSLGLPPIAVNWLVVANAGIAIALNALNRVW